MPSRSIRRSEQPKLFEGVAETLLNIKGRGTRIIGYTESMGFYSNYRLRRLGLDGVLDFVFCPEDHVLPSGLSSQQMRSYPASHYELQYTKQHFTPKGSKKPDAAVLNAIIADLGLNKNDCVYVGDNVSKDIAMALECGVDAAWAEYGQAHKRPEYKLLVEVTHWTPQEVAREVEIRARIHVHPTHVLSNSLSEILGHFEFRDFHEEKPKLTEDARKSIVEVWKTIVGVQQHFNDIGMRIRSMFVTILLALFASIGFLIDKKLAIPLGGYKIQFAAVVFIIGALGTGLFYFIDRYWYHRLLIGSVKQGMSIEKRYKDEMPELSLTEAIGKESPYSPKGRFVRLIAWLVVKEPRYKETGNLHSDGKIELFYKPIIYALLAAAAAIALFGGISWEGPTVQL